MGQTYRTEYNNRTVVNLGLICLYWFNLDRSTLATTRLGVGAVRVSRRRGLDR